LRSHTESGKVTPPRRERRTHTIEQPFAVMLIGKRLCQLSKVALDIMLNPDI
jgi:hypothetical protein